jgi:TolA-binding protein
MTTPLRRLKDDPDFLWETGCDLADEAFSTGGYDLPRMRANVLAATQAPSGGAPLRSPRLVWPWVAGAVVVAVALLAGGLWMVVGDSVEAQVGAAAVGLPTDGERVDATPALDPVAPTAMEPVEVAARPVASVVGAAAPTVASAVAPASTPVGAAPPEAVAPVAFVATPLPSSGELAVVDDGEAVAAVEPAGGPSTLAVELAAYDRANDQLSGGAFAEAVAGFVAYLEAYPSGRLRTEAQLGLLHAYVGMADGEAVERHAAAVQDLPTLSGKRGEILRMRAENLVWLERCDDALDVAHQLSGRDAANVRRACRWKQ